MNIFICQTPFQLFYTHLLINNLSKETDSFFIIHSDLDLNSNWCNKVEFLNIREKKGIFNEFIQLKKAVKAINDKVDSSYSPVNFYIPHIGGLLPNYVFYNTRLSNNPNIHVNFYYEGALYFYDFKESFQFFHLKRILIARVLGFSYKVSKTILPYNAENIKYIYTPFKKFTKGPKNKLVEVTLDNKLNSGKINLNHFLILGGPISYLKEFYEMSINEILKSNLVNPKIFYKGHSSFNTHNNKDKETFHEISKKYNLDYEELDSNIPIELLLDKIEPFRIYSYYSSSLLNIKSMYRNSYEIVCCFDNNQPNELLEKIFKYYDISVIKIN